MRPWYCAQTIPQKEFAAQEQLERNGFTTFLPCYWKRYKSRNIRMTLLFKNYVFVSLEDPVEWPEVQRSLFVHRFMTHAPDDANWYYMPSPIASEEIEQLRQLGLAYNEDDSKPPKQFITEGCYVKVKSGAFMNEDCAQKALVEWSDSERASLLLKIFNRDVKVEFYHHDLELVER